MVSQIYDDEFDIFYPLGLSRKFITIMNRFKVSQWVKELESDQYQFMTTNTRPWTIEQKSRLIESLIMNIPISHIICYEIDFEQYQLIDGNQRVKAIDDFYHSRFQLVGLEAYPEMDGLTYDTLPDRTKLALDNKNIPTVTIMEESDQAQDDFLENTITMIRNRYDGSFKSKRRKKSK